MSAAAEFDLAITGGRVFDPADGTTRTADVAFAAGRVAEVGDALGPRARETVDASGRTVAPGFIDLHGHFFRHGFRSCVDADDICPPSGVTTAVDAGSAGFVTFPGFLEHVVPRTTTRLFGFVNLAALGLSSVSLGVPELRGLELVRVDETVAAIAEARGVAVGVKVRADVKATEPEHVIPALRLARQVAQLSGTRVMVHVGDVPTRFGSILEQLAPGDVVTHVYHGGPTGLLDRAGRVESAAWDARSAGVRFDVGHAGSHIDLEVARAAIEQGFPPDSISTDVHRPPPGRVTYPLPEIASAFLGLGLDLRGALAALTRGPAAAIDRLGELGALEPGASGDAVVFDLEPGEFDYVDGRGHTCRSATRLRVHHTVTRGIVTYPGSDPAGGREGEA